MDKYYEDPTLTSYGEEVREWGGAFAVYRGLSDSIPYHRLFNSPISEAAIVGSAVGYAMAGGRVDLRSSCTRTSWGVRATRCSTN